MTKYDKIDLAATQKRVKEYSENHLMPTENELEFPDVLFTQWKPRNWQ